MSDPTTASDPPAGTASLHRPDPPRPGEPGRLACVSAFVLVALCLLPLIALYIVGVVDPTGEIGWLIIPVLVVAAPTLALAFLVGVVGLVRAARYPGTRESTRLWGWLAVLLSGLFWLWPLMLLAR
jgi:hypothetical protein